MAEGASWQLGLAVAHVCKCHNQHFTLDVSVMFGSCVCVVKTTVLVPALKLGAWSMFAYHSKTGTKLESCVKLVPVWELADAIYCCHYQLNVQWVIIM